MKQLVAICLFLTFSISSFGQEYNTLLEEIIEQIAEESEEELDSVPILLKIPLVLATA